MFHRREFVAEIEYLDKKSTGKYAANHGMVHFGISFPKLKKNTF